MIRKNYANLSQGQKKVADYFIKNPDLASYQTIASISEEVGVSEATVIRFSYSLGFGSFSSMQKKLRNEFIENVKKADHIQNLEEIEEENLRDNIISKEINYISEIQSNISEVQLSRISKFINNSEDIYCVAGRNVHAAAEWFGMSLDKIKGNTYFDAIEGESYYSNLMKISEKSLVIVISFSRYSKQSYEFTKTARKKGALILAITDSIVSPVAQIADEILLVKSKVSEYGFNSICPVMAVFDVLLAYYIEAYPKETSERLKELEELYTEKENLYFE